EGEGSIDSTVAITEKHIYYAWVGQKGGTHAALWGLVPMLPPAARARETMAAMTAANLALLEKDQEELNRMLVLALKLYRVKSRGSVTVTSTDAAAEPTVDFAYFTHPDDVSDGIEGVRILKAVRDSRALTPLKWEKVPGTLLRLVPDLANLPPGAYRGALPLIPDLDDESAATTWLKADVCTSWHMHGTCRVGEVVDEEHRVKGVGGLRVMDASVFRDSRGTNPMATIMAVGRAFGLRMRKERGT
ncbi:GMC oxidoreductase family, partial [Klebsormidium nitens]